MGQSIDDDGVVHFDSAPKVGDTTTCLGKKCTVNEKVRNVTLRIPDHRGHRVTVFHLKVLKPTPPTFFLYNMGYCTNCKEGWIQLN